MVQEYRESDKFQSLAGFFVACNELMLASRAPVQCFNPWRVFSWLATQFIIFLLFTPIIRFQSLAGFFVACNGAGARTRS